MLKLKCQSPGMQVELINLSFNYPENDRLTLTKLNLSIKRGSLVALVGKKWFGEKYFNSTTGRFV